MQELPPTKYSWIVLRKPSQIFIIIGASTLFVLLLGAIFYFLLGRQDSPVIPLMPLPIIETRTPSLLEEENPIILTVPNVTPPAEITNPVQNLPDTNPFEVKTNPFKDTYRNPFE